MQRNAGLSPRWSFTHAHTRFSQGRPCVKWHIMEQPLWYNTKPLLDLCFQPNREFCLRGFHCGRSIQCFSLHPESRPRSIFRKFVHLTLASFAWTVIAESASMTLIVLTNNSVDEVIPLQKKKRHRIALASMNLVLAILTLLLCLNKHFLKCLFSDFVVKYYLNIFHIAITSTCPKTLI